MRRATVLCVVAVGASACGSGARSLNAQGLRLEYPSSFRAGTAVGARPPGQLLGIVGASREDYIAVRGRRGAPLALASLKAALPSIVAGVVPATVTTERHSGLEMVSAVQRSDAGTEAGIYLFNGGGRTWEVECRSTQARRAEIRSACARALASIRIG